MDYTIVDDNKIPWITSSATHKHMSSNDWM